MSEGTGERGSGDLTPSDATQDASATLATTHPHLTDLVDAAAPPPARAFRERWGMYGDDTNNSPDVSGYGGIVRQPDMPGPSTPPFGGWFDDVADTLGRLAPGSATRVVVHRGQITFFVKRERLLEVVRIMRDDPDLRFEMCTSVSGVHYPDQTGTELHVVYQMLSLTHNRRVSLEVEVADADPHVPSVVSVYPMVNFHERETWDMFGVIFDGHPALTRILMPDDWVGHPQRKDYPLGGIPVEFKGAVVPSPDQRRSFQ